MRYDVATLAAEAERLLRDAVLKQALEDMRLDALADLIEVNPTNSYEVIRHQVRVKTIDEFLYQLERYVIAQPDRE
jgi:hypothetical protein